MVQYKHRLRPRGEEETRLSAKQLCTSSILVVASKMTKIKSIFALFAALVWVGVCLPKIAIAQDFSFDKAFQDYQFSLTQYQQAYSDYIYAKGAYLMNPTLNLKDDARNKTLNLLTNHNQLLKVYLSMLRMKIVEDNGLMDNEKNSIMSEIDSEIEWYSSNKNKLSDSDSLETLFNKSEDLKSRYTSTTNSLIKKSMAYITLGEEISIKNSQNQIYGDLKIYIESVAATGKLSLAPFNRWFTDINKVNDSLSQNESNIREQISKIADSFVTSESAYGSCIELLSSSTVHLSQYNQFLTQVLNYIKNYDD